MTTRKRPARRKATDGAWPALPLAEWADTCETVHRWTQILGKTRLALSPFQNHWWHSALYLTARGIGTSPMPAGQGELDLELDFIDHLLWLRLSDGRARSLALKQGAVADFYRGYLRAVKDLGVRLQLFPVPIETSDRLPLDQDRVHTAYDRDAAHRFWRVLTQGDRVLKAFRGRFVGKSSPSHFWWGGFDLACTRFNGRAAPRHPGGIPNCPNFVTREAYSHQCISVGWWPGNVGGMEQPAFYAYAYPEPPGCSAAPVRPSQAYYHSGMREWLLPYEAVRQAKDPAAAVMAFCQSTYEVAAGLGGWDRPALERAAREGEDG